MQDANARVTLRASVYVEHAVYQAESQLCVGSFMCATQLPEEVLTLTLLLREACLPACNKRRASKALGGDMAVKPNFTGSTS